MKITVILCTYNRCCELRKALSSLAAQNIPAPIAWEVLVVDNNSHDQTQEVVEDFSREYPGRFRYLLEPQQGKSYALNSGIREAQGDVLAFMDDDVTVDPTWLQNLTAPLLSCKSVGSGGRILPERGFSPPRWFPRKDRYAFAVLALFDLGPEAGELAEPPFGTNMAFHKKMFETYGGFRPDLGPCPGSEIRGEDTEFGRRLLNAGEQLRYEPSAVVYHAVPRQRLTRKYYLSWWFDKGRSDGREYGISSDLFRRIAVGTLRWIVALEPSQRFSRRLAVWHLAGMIVESNRQSIEGKRQRMRSEPRHE
jgi:glucosyl-dolichyl phosphate glucuronosyltransferase